MPDTVTTTTNRSWFSRIGSAVGGVLIGLLLIAACVFGLSWNEGNAVKVERGLNEGAGRVVEAESATVLPENDQKLVHVVGDVRVTDTLRDLDFGVTALGVRLDRTVEMYQWQEEVKSESRTKLGGGEETVTTYTYTRVWSADALDSSQFNTPAGHQNPAMTIEGTRVYAQDATLGAYRLQHNVLGQIEGGQSLALGNQSEAIEAAAGQGRTLSVSSDTIFLGRDATTPAIGDTRITYSVVAASEISVVARQDSDSFAGYRARNGSEFLLVAQGRVSAAEMFQTAHDANNLMAWVFRVGGMLLLVIGFGLILAPFGVLADVLPLAGTIVRMGTGLIAFVLGVAVGTVTIALAWLAFRPITAITILAVGGLMAFGVWKLARGRAKKALAAETTTA